MKKFLISFILFLSSLALQAQSNWEFQVSIETHNYYLLEGMIDDKYPIELYLTSNGFCGDLGSRDAKRVFSGWYSYKKIGKRLPLIGSMFEVDITLYVPSNASQHFLSESCKLDSYTESFFTDSDTFPDSLKWKTTDIDTSYSVHLTTIHDFTFNTDVSIEFKLRDVVISQLDLTELTGIEHIQQAEVIASKEVDNHFYALVKFGHRTNPESNGSGHCGAGYEEYVGFIELNEALELEKFEFIKTESCFAISSKDAGYSYDTAHPEIGFFLK